MTKDEMKNRISMALKDPILQQGFEIICKNLAELEKENAELKDYNEELLQSVMDRWFQLKRSKEQLTEAKELLKRWVDDKVYTVSEQKDLIADTEQFLNSEVKK